MWVGSRGQPNLEVYITKQRNIFGLGSENLNFNATQYMDDMKTNNNNNNNMNE